VTAYGVRVLTAGVDLAAEAKKTATACVAWTGGGASIEHVKLGVSDEQLVALAGSVDKLGLDCPLGWPDTFVDFLVAHRESTVVTPADVAGRDWCRRLANRATDLVVRQQIGIVPLSVAADRIGLTAMRAAGVLSFLAQSGAPVDRAGGGVVVEVYPAAALKGWGLHTESTKAPLMLAQSTNS
jgi:predicted nuclease with RNAse H fold